MSKIIKLSKKALAICSANLEKNCGNCQLRPKCAKHCGIGTNALNNWLLSVNNLAESMKGK